MTDTEMLDKIIDAKIVLLEQRTNEFFDCLESTYIKKECTIEQYIDALMMPKKKTIIRAVNTSTDIYFKQFLIKNYEKYYPYIKSLTS